MCSRDTSYQNPNITEPDTKIYSRCSSKYKGFYPSFNPVINSLSIKSSPEGIYSLVYINGSNFLPLINGITYVNFGSFKKLPITFYNSFNISFVVPLYADVGDYNVVVVNVYNGNFSPPINKSYPGNPNYSNIIPYEIT
jgi:hypothetical protein